MINKFSRHLGQKYRGDHRSRTRPHFLQMCSTSPRTVILSIPREDILGCQFLLTRSIGPDPSSRIVGTQGKIGPHNTYVTKSVVTQGYNLLLFIRKTRIQISILYYCNDQIFKYMLQLVVILNWHSKNNQYGNMHISMQK